MGLEIERKFLVRGDGWRQAVQRSERLRQGYLSAEGGRASIRVRLGEQEARLNIKAAVVGSARAEYDYAIPRSEGEEIFAQLCVGRLEKQRHWVTHEGHVWEIDEFEGENTGLVIAELELSAIDEDFTRPDWLGEEVTDDRRYYNHHLALHPYCSWSHR